MIEVAKIKAIDGHDQLDMSCFGHADPMIATCFDTAHANSWTPRARPSIPETAATHPEVTRTVCPFARDRVTGMGSQRISNSKVAAFAFETTDIAIPFESTMPPHGQNGREARDHERQCKQAARADIATIRNLNI